MPQVDFNSDDPDSLINSADEVYTSNEFNNLLNNNSEVNLNGIIYVQGNINIPRDTVLTINGALVSEGHISIGAYWWPFWEPKPSLIINDPGSGPVGLLSMRKISFESEVDSIDITGLIYATDKLTFWVYGLNFDLTAGIITRQLIINSLWQPIVINYDQELIARTLGSPATAPIIDVEHWEEEY